MDIGELDQMEVAAYHEAGHVARFMAYGLPFTYVALLGDDGGVTKNQDDVDDWRTWSDLLLGGAVAEVAYYRSLGLVDADIRWWMEFLLISDLGAAHDYDGWAPEDYGERSHEAFVDAALAAPVDEQQWRLISLTASELLRLPHRLTLAQVQDLYGETVSS